MPRIQDPRLSENLRRRFQIKGADWIDTLAPELVGVVLVDDMTGPELERYFIRGDGRGAVGVGTYNTWQIDNPAGSGKLVRVTAGMLTLADANGWRANFAQGDLSTTLADGFALDRRDTAGPAARCRYENLGAQILAPIWHAEDSIAQETFNILAGHHVFLMPGDQLTVQLETAQIAGSHQWYWSERELRAED